MQHIGSMSTNVIFYTTAKSTFKIVKAKQQVKKPKMNKKLKFSMRVER